RRRLRVRSSGSSRSTDGGCCGGRASTERAEACGTAGANADGSNGGRERDPDGGAGRLAVRRVGAAPVGLCDRPDDRKAEPGAAAAARGIRPREALEGALEERGREAVPVVADVQLDPAVDVAGLERDRVAAVAERVVDEVSERLLQPEPVAADARARPLGAKPLALRGGTPFDPAEHRREAVADLAALDAP